MPALVSAASLGWALTAVPPLPETGAAALRLNSAAVRLSATALVLGATNQILSIPRLTTGQIHDFVDYEYRNYIGATGLCGRGPEECTLVAVYGPAQFWPFTGLFDLTLDASVAAGAANLDACLRGTACTVTEAPYLDTEQRTVADTAYVVRGNSQAAIISGVEKARLIADPVSGATVSFVLTSSPNRPNGGLFARFPGISVAGITFNGATPTNSSRTAPLTTVDIARQYDGWDDFPTNPLNVLADVNAAMGALFLHAQPLYTDGPAQLQGYYRDTTYYLAPTAVLPILVPVELIPTIGMPLATAMDAPLRVLVETGYDRTVNPGQPTPVRLDYAPDPAKTMADLAVAIPTGWDDAIARINGDPNDRPFRTTPDPLYGVGGPPVYAGAIDPYGDVSAAPVTTPPSAASSESTADRSDAVSRPDGLSATRVRPSAGAADSSTADRTAQAARSRR